MVVRNKKYGTGNLITERNGTCHVDFGTYNEIVGGKEVQGRMVLVDGMWVEAISNVSPKIFNKKIYGNTKDVRGKWDFEYKKIYFGEGTMEIRFMNMLETTKIDVKMSQSYRAARKIRKEFLE